MTGSKKAPSPKAASSTLSLPTSQRVSDGGPVSKECYARETANGFIPNAMVLDAYMPNSSFDCIHMLRELERIGNNIQAGDFSEVENALTYQALSLNAMFADLAVRARKERTIAGAQCFTQLALRAQSGSRATFQALAEIRNPRQVAFVRQTNVAQNQQVNNGTALPSRGKKSNARQTNY